MESNTLKLSRRAFGRLSMSVLPATAAEGLRSDRHAQFVRDVTRSYELQIIALDMEDVRHVLRAMQAPVLTCGVATGTDRAARAVNAALRHAGRVSRRSLIVVAAAPCHVRLLEYKQIYEAIRAHAPLDATLIYTACDDTALPPGSLRVSLLSG